MGTHVALLRGINVGGKRVVPMKTLADVFEKAGATNVRTYIQSGNVVFDAKTVPSSLGAALEKKFKFEIPIVLRTKDELFEVTEGNPWKKDADVVHVVFLADAPTKKQIADLDPKRSPPDEFRVAGRDIYLRCPNGVGKSKLTNAYFDSKLETISTLRNWRTVLALLDLCR